MLMLMLCCSLIADVNVYEALRSAISILTRTLADPEHRLQDVEEVQRQIQAWNGNIQQQQQNSDTSTQLLWRMHMRVLMFVSLSRQVFCPTLRRCSSPCAAVAVPPRASQAQPRNRKPLIELHVTISERYGMLV